LHFDFPIPAEPGHNLRHSKDGSGRSFSAPAKCPSKLRIYQWLHRYIASKSDGTGTAVRNKYKKASHDPRTEFFGKFLSGTLSVFLSTYRYFIPLSPVLSKKLFFVKIKALKNKKTVIPNKVDESTE